MWGGRVGTLAYTYMLKIHDLAGVIPALATPLTRDGGVDEAGVERLVGHVLAGGGAGPPSPRPTRGGPSPGRGARPGGAPPGRPAHRRGPAGLRRGGPTPPP